MRRMYEGPLPITKKDIDRLPKLYAEVFAGNPWYEVSRCETCGSFSRNVPSEEKSCNVPGCTGTYSLPAYPEEETLAYIRTELQRPMAIGIQQVRMESVCQVIEDVFAFGWGFASDGGALSQEKYSTKEMRALLSDLLIKARAFFYLSEVGVRENEQGRGIGTAVTSTLTTFGKRKLGTVVLRTNEASPMRYIAQNLGMKPIIGLDTGIIDRENEARVIFVGGKYDRE